MRVRAPSRAPSVAARETLFKSTRRQTLNHVRLLSAAQLSKAIERAKASNLLVQRTSIYRQYRVTNRATGAQYAVNCFVTVGMRYGHCDCKAGVRHMVCKHLAAAAGLHVMIAAERADAQIRTAKLRRCEIKIVSASPVRPLSKSRVPQQQ